MTEIPRPPSWPPEADCPHTQRSWTHPLRRDLTAEQRAEPHACPACERKAERYFGNATRREPTDAEWLEAHLAHIGYEVIRVTRARETVEWLDRQLRRWPWLYRRLGGDR